MAGSALHIGPWSIIALRDLLVPSSCRILILDRLCRARNLLLGGRSFCCIPRLIMGWECF
ncbi:hypothetical protein BB934_13885 [Microvirga ossetica]|uniref:Uncharacterized protein n=1 Tax=Microvirga ossetica TaxID=1882682 RepID=A0A1B2EGU4_9HYPH|nr:hypothetical protein BB934_13885 [Microvirga ossetica]